MSAAGNMQVFEFDLVFIPNAGIPEPLVLAYFANIHMGYIFLIYACDLPIHKVGFPSCAST